MTTRTILSLAAAGAFLCLAATQAPVHADTGFGALAGIPAEAMSAAEMEATQGRFVPCVSEICGGAGGWFSGSPFAGANIAPSSSSFIYADIAAAYPWVWNSLFPGLPPGGLAAVDTWLLVSLGNVNASLGMVGLGF